MRRKRGARRLKINDKISDNQFVTYFYCFIRTYLKSEEAPLCRIEFQLITTSHGNGISPKLSKNLHKVRQVGTLPAVKQANRKAKSLPTLRRKYKFRAELGEGGAYAPKEGRRKTKNKR